MMKKNFKKQVTLREKGQVLIVVALTIMMLLAIIGLAVDTGYVYVSYARLRRAVDAAALAATGEFKRNYKIEEMKASAMQQLKLNGMLIEPTTDGHNPDVLIKIMTCDNDGTPSGLCPEEGKPAEKLVRIQVTQDVPMFFLSAWGIYRVPISIDTVAQAASIDLVLLIQNSESMAFDTLPFPSAVDPSVCNPVNACLPFEDVKSAAKAFVNNLMYFPYDRVAIVTYNKTAKLVLPLSDEQENGVMVDTVTPALTHLEVFNPDPCLYTTDTRDTRKANPPVAAPIDPFYTFDPKSPCRPYSDTGVYASRFDCPMFWAKDDVGNYTPDNDPSWCGTTNPSAGLAMAGNHLQGAYPETGWSVDDSREDAVWVILLLATGAPNSAQDDDSEPICPKSTLGPDFHRAGCRDLSVVTRHCFIDDTLVTNTCMGAKYDITGTDTVFMTSVYDPTNYDAYDRAFDMVDVQVANGVFLFTIGLGKQVNENNNSDYPPGSTFLKYAAKVGGGIYRPAKESSDLKAIFLEIANKIATKINQ